MIERYKIAKPITYDELLDYLPRYKAMPIWWDNECYLMYWNIWGEIYYMSPNSRGVLRGSAGKKYMYYTQELEPQFIVEEREYCNYTFMLSKVYTNYKCPNCNCEVDPYNYDFKRIFASGQVRQNFCSECGYPLLWY